jgi:hypothetical protein
MQRIKQNVCMWHTTGTRSFVLCKIYGVPTTVVMTESLILVGTLPCHALERLNVTPTSELNLFFYV